MFCPIPLRVALPKCPSSPSPGHSPVAEAASALYSSVRPTTRTALSDLWKNPSLSLTAPINSQTPAVSALPRGLAAVISGTGRKNPSLEDRVNFTASTGQAHPLLIFIFHLHKAERSITQLLPIKVPFAIKLGNSSPGSPGGR